MKSAGPSRNRFCAPGRRRLTIIYTLSVGTARFSEGTVCTVAAGGGPGRAGGAGHDRPFVAPRQPVERAHREIRRRPEGGGVLVQPRGQHAQPARVLGCQPLGEHVAGDLVGEHAVVRLGFAVRCISAQRAPVMRVIAWCRACPIVATLDGRRLVTKLAPFDQASPALEPTRMGQ